MYYLRNNEQSIKTRIKTKTAELSALVKSVTMNNPLKQGLKQTRRFVVLGKGEKE